MWRILIIAAVIVWPGSAQDQQVYLTTYDTWAFYKILVTGQMTNANVKATCEAAGMRYPCRESGTNGCTFWDWTSDCITYDSAGISCNTHWVLASKLCATGIPQHCQPLDDTFVYKPDPVDLGAFGVDYDLHGYIPHGAGYSNMYAICADVATCQVSPCVHGTCTDDVGSYTCTCENGWGGLNCDQMASCQFSQCVHGTCTDDISGYTCTCESGWGGTNCDQNQQVYLATHDNWAFYKVLVSGQMTNANIKATCEAAGMRYPCYGSGTDRCTGSWTSDCITCNPVGSDCLIHYILASILCGDTYPEQCQPLDDTFLRMLGWAYDSSIGVDYDTHTYALVGSDHANKYALCAVATCARSPCVHGTCTDDVVGYTCTCENGWEGTNCDQNIDDCASSPCTHGTCTDGIANYTCSCENGWTGLNCDQDIDECASSPCLLGGTCLDHVDGYSCVCPKDATGKNCDTVTFSGECYQFSTSAVTHRDAIQACSTNNGHLVDMKDAQQQQFLTNTIVATTGVSNWLAMKTTTCPILYSDGSPVIAPLQWSTGEPSSPPDLCVLLDSSDSYKATTAFCTEQHNYVCQDELKPCEPNVCQNSGNCTSCFGGSTTFCDCLDGFEGKLCEINVNECLSDPCQHGGTCLDRVNSYNCRCPTGYSGDNCETEIDWCAMVTCPLDFTCQNMITHFICLAPIVRMLEPYKCSSASCPGDMHCREETDASFSCWVN